MLTRPRSADRSCLEGALQDVQRPKGALQDTRNAQNPLRGTPFHDLDVSVDVSCVAVLAVCHPERGFMNIPNPVHDLGANAVVLGTNLWTTGDCLWINLAQVRVVHGDTELSPSCTQAPSPGFDTSRRADVRVIHTIHSPYYYYWFSLLRVINKEKAGGACARTHASRSGSQEGRTRVERSNRTLYGDEQRLCFLEAASADRVTPRVWKGFP